MQNFYFDIEEVQEMKEDEVLFFSLYFWGEGIVRSLGHFHIGKVIDKLIR